MRMFNNSFFIKYIAALLLFVFGVLSFSVHLKTIYFEPGTLDIFGNLDQLISTKSGEMIKGDKARGSFNSGFINLGSLSLRFYNQFRSSDDTIIVRIREMESKKWFFEESFETKQFLPHKYTTFSFPTIKDSDGKQYEFELESLRGTTGSGTLIDKKNPVFIAKSYFTYQGGKISDYPMGLISLSASESNPDTK